LRWLSGKTQISSGEEIFSLAEALNPPNSKKLAKPTLFPRIISMRNKKTRNAIVQKYSQQPDLDDLRY